MRGSVRNSILQRAGSSLSPTGAATPGGPNSPNGNTANNKSAGGLGLRRTSWQRHLSPRMQRIMEQAAEVMDGPVVLTIIVLATLMAIFLEDIKVLSFNQDVDVRFTDISLFLFCLFLLELLINTVVKAGYLFSFFFWLDLISAFSMLPDIPIIWNPMIGLKQTDSTTDDSDDASFQIDRIRRVSRTGERLLQLLKFVKLIRLGRIAKLFEMAQRTLEERARLKRRLQHSGDDSNTVYAQDYTESSQVGSALSEQTTRKVVLLVLVMMLVIPLLQNTTEERAQDYIIGELNYMASSPHILGSVYAKVDHADNQTLWAIAANETAQAEADGFEVRRFLGTTLADMLSNYNPNLGQPLVLGENTRLVSPSFNYTYIQAAVGAANYSVAVAALHQARDGMEQQFRWCIAQYQSTMLYLRVRGSYFANDFLVPELFQLRTSEMIAAEDGTGGGGKSFGIFNRLDDARKAALYSVLRTLTVLVLLTVGAIAFNRNNHEMVIQPIERMVATIQQLQKNPLARAVIDEDAAEELAALQAAQKKEAAKAAAAASAAATPKNVLEKLWSFIVAAWTRWYDSGPKASTSNETGMLERTLEKLTSLLQVGLGEAGTRMIEKCMSENVDGDLDPLVDGTRMLGIFGFCDIRRFTDATEVLKEDVMLYVNEIAAIVHAHCSALAGHPNKNVGDAFLVIWRLKPVHAIMDPDDLFHINEVQPCYQRDTLVERKKWLELQDASKHSQAERDYAEEARRKREEKLLLQRAKQAACNLPPIRRPLHPLTLAQLSVQADRSVVAFLRVIVDLDASEELRAYENDPRIYAAFGGDFQVQLGFGLHCGWAIEGPIGSRYKIDASYLSPHVNLSEALQDLTKEYGLPLLVSGEFYTLLSPYLKSFMRRLDVVKVAGRDVPMNLYGFDIHPAALKAVIARQTPAEYDVDADVDVVELKQSFFNKTIAREASTHADAEPDEPVSPVLPDRMESPLSPGPARVVDDPLAAHPLFSNPYLNPHMSDFSAFEYSGDERRAIHAASPIAKHHLVYNFRLQVLQCGIPYAFHDMYAAGLDLYLAGDWTAARAKMDEARRLHPADKPTQVILGVMAEHNFVAPDNWPGWHEA